MSETTKSPPTNAEAVFWAAMGKVLAKEADRCAVELLEGLYEVHAIAKGRVVPLKGRRKAVDFDERVVTATVEVQEPRDTISSPKAADLVAAIFSLLGVKSAKRIAVQLQTFAWDKIPDEARQPAAELLASMKTRKKGRKKRVGVSGTIEAAD